MNQSSAPVFEPHLLPLHIPNHHSLYPNQQESSSNIPEYSSPWRMRESFSDFQEETFDASKQENFLTETEVSKLLNYSQRSSQDEDEDDDKEGLQSIVKKVLYNHLQAKGNRGLGTTTSTSSSNWCKQYDDEGRPTNRVGYHLITPPLSPKDEFAWQQQQQLQQPQPPQSHLHGEAHNLVASQAYPDTLDLGTSFHADNQQSSRQFGLLKRSYEQYEQVQHTNVYDNSLNEHHKLKKTKGSKPRTKSTITSKPVALKHTQKRNAHLSAEFRYRTKLNDKINKLRSLVGYRDHLSKSAVLTQSIDTIMKLHKLIEQFGTENGKLRERVSAYGEPQPSSIDLSWYDRFTDNLKNFVHEEPTSNDEDEDGLEQQSGFTNQMEPEGSELTMIDYKKSKDLQLFPIKLEIDDTYIEQLIDENINGTSNDCFDALDMIEHF